MEVGMVFTIEPMLTLGTHEWDMWEDNWTVTTKDKSITAQFEHTLVVTERGADILTLPSPAAAAA
jgi:methionyl aminopeptidase